MKKFTGVLFSLLFTVFFISCEIGLGEAVDTQAPSLNITTPEPDSVIRDAFRLSGTWSDDGSISRLTVELKRTDGISRSIPTFTGTVNPSSGKNAESSWYCVIDPVANNILDGTYVATVRITDTGEHTTIQSRQFVIDNTAPIVVLQRPSTETGSDDYDSYGQKLTIEGQAADDSNINLIEVSVFGTNDFSVDPIKTVQLKNVPPTVSLDFADWSITTGDSSWNDYQTIYGSNTEDGTKNRFCTIKVYDSAQRYPADGSAQSDADKLGNTTDKYYLYSDLSADVLQDYKITELYHMLNGTYGAENNSRSMAADDVIQTKLAGKEKTSSQFSMNPDNSPKFVVSGRSVLETGKNLDSEGYQITSGNSKLEVEVSPGLDNITIDPDTIGIYLKECDIDGTILPAGAVVDIVNPWKSKDGTELMTETAYKAQPFTRKISGSSYKFTTTKMISPLPDCYPGLAIGKYYKVVVTGNDKAKNDISNVSIYAFKLISTGNFIELSAAISPKYVSKQADAGSEYKKADVTLTMIGTGPYEILRNNVSIASNQSTPWTEVIPVAEVGSPDSSSIIKKEVVSGETKYYISYKVKGSEASESNEKKVYLTYDNDNPSLSNVEYPDSTATESASFRFKGNASDATSGIKAVKMRITDETVTPNKSVLLTMSGYEDWYKDVKPADTEISASGVFANEGKKKIEIWAEDNVELKSSSEIKSNWVFDKSKPEIGFTATNGTTNPTENTYRNSGFKLETAAFDSYGIDSVFVTTSVYLSSEPANWGSTYYKDVECTDAVAAGAQFEKGTYYLQKIDFAKTATDPATKEETWAKQFIVGSEPAVTGAERLADNTYTFVITVKDKAGKTNSVSRKFTVDTTIPVVSTPDLTWPDSPATGVPHKKTTATLSIEGKITDDNIETVYYYVNDGSDITKKVVAGIPQGVSDADWNVIAGSKTVSFSDGNGSIWIKAVDKAGNVGYSTAQTYNVDSTPPHLVTLNKVDGETLAGSKLINGSNDVIFTVSAKDMDNGYTNGVANGAKSDRVASVNLSYVDQVVTPADANSGVGVYSSINDEWTVKIPKALFVTSGTKTVKVLATDKAGNSKEYELFNIDLDNISPVTEIISPTVSTVNGTQTLSGTVTENNPKSVALYYRTEAPAVADSSNTTIAGWTLLSKITTVADIYNWSFTNVDFNALSTADASASTGYKHDIYWLAYAEDTAGNYSAVENNWKKYTVDMDADRPVIQVMNNVVLKYNNNDMAADNRVGITSKTLSVSVSDDDGVSVFEYKIDNGAYTAATQNGSSYTIPLSNDGPVNIYFHVKDSKGEDFYTSDSTTYSLGSPKLTDGTNEYGYFNNADPTKIKPTLLYAKVDTTAPLVQPAEFRLTNSDGTEAVNSSWDSSIISTAFGGTKNKYFKLRQYAYDVNGIESASITVDGVVTPISFSATGNKKTFKVGGVDTEFVEWVSDNIDVSAWTSGTKTCSLTVSDGVNEKVTPIILVIDNDAPTVSITSPSATDDPVYGNIVVRGSSEAGATLYYTLSLDGTNKPSETAGSTITKWTGYDIDESGIKTADINNGSVTSNVPVSDYAEFDSDKGLSWTIYFDGNTTITNATHLQQLLNYLFDFNVTTSDAVTREQFKSIVNMYLWIKAEDEVGNSSETPFLIKLDPQGGRPTITIDSPESEPKDGKVDSFGGAFKVYGSAEDLEEGVQSVWLQIVSDKHRIIENTEDGKKKFKEELDGSTGWGSCTPATKTDNSVTSITITSKDLDYWATAGYTVQKMKAESNGTHTDWVIGTVVSNDEAAKYAIKCDITGSTWRRKLNEKNEFSPVGTGAGSVATLAMRVYAYDGGKLSYPKSKKFEIDNDKPYITDVKIEQYDSNNALLARREYASGVCVKGSSAIFFTANDNSEIGEVSYQTKKGNDLTEKVILTAISGTREKKNYKISLPTGTANSVGSLELIITVTDTTNNDKTENYVIKYDNKAPRIANTTNPNYGIKPKVQQSNGFYTIKSFVTDAETGVTPSGIDSVAFYFLRRGTTTAKVFDPMLVRDGITDVAAAKNLGDAGAGNVVYAEGLFWKKVSITVSADNEDQFTIAAGDVDANFHKGGLCKVNGINYRISDIDDSKTLFTLNGNPDSTSTEAYFALAMVVNNTVSEFADGEKNTTDGYYVKPGNDDGDRMIEVMDGTSVEATWEAQIVSRNIPDGPIEIHYVAFDKAGNYSIGIVGNKDWATYKAYQTADAKAVHELTPTPNTNGTFVYAYDPNNTAYISNNAPRVVGVTIGTNFDNSKDAGGNPTFTSNEYITRYYSSLEGKPTDVISSFIVSSKPDQSKGMADNGYGIYKLKSDSVIIPEIIGGNNEMYYQYNITAPESASSNYVPAPNVASIPAAKWSATTASIANKWATSGTDAYDDYLDAYGYIDVENKKIAEPIVFTEDTLKNEKSTTVDKPTWFTIRIWDHTEETTPFVNSQYATLQIALANMVKDTTPPNISVDPFYWNGANDNSLYENSYKNGHIDLSKDLNSVTYVNPDASGTVTFRGTVLDDHKVGSIWAKFGSAGTGYITCGNAVAGTTVTEDGYYCVAKRNNNNTWEKATKAAGSNWDFKFDDSKAQFTVDGELLYWELSIDTSVLGHADNVRLEMMARDGTYGTVVDGAPAPNAEHQSKNVNYSYVETVPSSNIKNGQTVYSALDYNVPYYDVDLVPYIGGVLDSNGVEVDRSRLGSYNVRAGQTIRLKGFNFGSTVPAIYRNKSVDKATTGGQKSGDITVSGTPAYNPDGTLSITVPEKSGYIRAVWGTGASAISTPNNTNANVKYNISEGLVLSDNDSGLKKANDAGSNFWTDDVYLSVWKVGEYFNTSTGSRWGRVEATPTEGYVTGEQTRTLPANRLFGVWAANNSSWQEIYPATAAVQDNGTRVVNLYGGSSDAARDAPPSCIDMAFPRVAPGVTLNQTYNRPFYVMLDNAFNKNQVWSGLEVYRDRQGYAQKANGSEHSIDNNDYRTIMTEKFINPSMSVFYNPSADMNTYGPSLSQHTDEGTYFVYVTYYDIYSHCLKYATLMYAGYYDNTDYGKAKVLVSSTLGKGACKGGIVVNGTTYTSESSKNVTLGGINYYAYSNGGNPIYSRVTPVVGTQMYTLSMDVSATTIASVEKYLIWGDDSYYRDSSSDANSRFAWSNGTTIIYSTLENITGGQLYNSDGTVASYWVGDTAVGNAIKIGDNYYTKSDVTTSFNNQNYYVLSYNSNYYYINTNTPTVSTQLFEIKETNFNTVTQYTSTIIKGSDDDDFTVEAGEWNDVVIDISDPATPKPVIAYYNKTERQVEIARGTGYAPAYNANGKDGGTWANFALSRPAGSTNFGQYVSMEIDAGNNLHIVAQDVTHNGALYYGYIPYANYASKSSGTLDVEWHVIDSTSNSTSTELKLENPSGSGAAAKPIVTYKDNAKADLTRAIKVAYVTNAASVTNPNDYQWDCLFDPAVYQIGEYKINLSSNVYDSTDTMNKCSVGFSSTEFAVDFLRNEE